MVDIINPFIHLLPFTLLMQATPSPFVCEGPAVPGCGAEQGGGALTAPAQSPACSGMSSKGAGWKAKALGCALDSGADLTGDFDQVWCFGRKGLLLFVFKSRVALLYAQRCGTEFSPCAIKGCCDIRPDVRRFLLSLLCSSVWKWHLQTRNTDNYSPILWESLI